jgi:hypothetical protein
MDEELPEFRTEDIPCIPRVQSEGERFVLGQNKDFPNTGIDTVTQGIINDPVFPTKRNSRLRAIPRQRVETNPDTAGQYKSNSVMDNF